MKTSEKLLKKVHLSSQNFTVEFHNTNVWKHDFLYRVENSFANYVYLHTTRILKPNENSQSKKKCYFVLYNLGPNHL